MVTTTHSIVAFASGGSRSRSLLSRGVVFSGSSALAQPLSAAFFFKSTLSARDVGWSRPTGSLTARVRVNSGSAPPRVSVWGASASGCVLSLSPRPRSQSPGTARLFSHRLVSAQPRALAANRPLGHSPVFPHVRRKACLFR